MTTTIIILILSLLLAAAAVIIFILMKRLDASRAGGHALEVELARCRERLAVIDTESEEHFDRIARKIIIDNSSRLSGENREAIARLIDPMKENLENFRRAYSEAYTTEAEKRAALDSQIKDLLDSNQRISRAAGRLADIIKGNSGAQGKLGEIVLENILDAAGLVRGRDYLSQKTIDSESAARPDIIINCPDNRHIIIDSKVSVTDYSKMCDADDPVQRRQYGEAHIKSLKRHVDKLRRTNYQEFLGGSTPDFVMMFIPHEGAYLAAMQLAPELWQTAFDGNVIIVSPTHLLSVVRLVAMMWRQDKQNRHALRIAEQGGKMIDKLAAFIDDMSKLRNSLKAAGAAFDAAAIKLEGRGGIRSIGEKMQELGAKASKSIPPRMTEGCATDDTGDDSQR